MTTRKYYVTILLHTNKKHILTQLRTILTEIRIVRKAKVLLIHQV